jgi:hypothetical protein
MATRVFAVAPATLPLFCCRFADVSAFTPLPPVFAIAAAFAAAAAFRRFSCQASPPPSSLLIADTPPGRALIIIDARCFRLIIAITPPFSLSLRQLRCHATPRHFRCRRLIIAFAFDFRYAFTPLRHYIISFSDFHYAIDSFIIDTPPFHYACRCCRHIR